MNKKIITAAIAIAALCGIPAMAQTDNNNTNCPVKKECTKGKQCQAEARAAREFRRMDAFNGIQLTDAQKAGLKAIKPDTTARKNPRQARRDYVNSVKNILTPDQYVVFLENIVVEDAGMPGGRHGKPMMRKGIDKKAHACDRGRHEHKAEKVAKSELKAKKADTVKKTAETK